MFLQLCLLKARILEHIASAMYSYIDGGGFWRYKKMIQKFVGTYENLKAQVDGIGNESLILGPSPSEVVSDGLTEIGENLDTCFNKLITLNFEEDIPDLLFASADELAEIHSARPNVPHIRFHLVENLMSDNSKSDKHNSGQHRREITDECYLTPPRTPEDDGEKHRLP